MSKINLLLSANEIFQANLAVMYMATCDFVAFHNIFNIASWRATCKQSVHFANITFDHFFVNCDAIEALLFSSTRCHFSHTCIYYILQKLINGHLGKFTAE
jgi:hypothetical protein